MKELELLLTIIVVTFIISLVFNQLFYLSKINNNQNIFLERLYAGRFILKNITETQPYADGICNLTQNFIYLFNQTNFTKYLEKYKIYYPVWLSIEYLNGTPIRTIGGYSNNYIEFRRVCNLEGKLVIVRIRI